MKIHGNIEAQRRPNGRDAHCLSSIHGWKSMATLKQYIPWKRIKMMHCIHGWKSMATLKLCVSSSLFPILSGIHGWKSMATLKQWHESAWTIWRTYLVSMDENPWQHWSLRSYIFTSTFNWYPWMKIHGNIEASFSGSGSSVFGFSYPWMKIHGNIEAEVPPVLP